MLYSPLWRSNYRPICPPPKWLFKTTQSKRKRVNSSYFHLGPGVNPTLAQLGRVNSVCFYCKRRCRACILYEPRHDKTIKVSVRPAKTQISLGICPVWSESSLSAWRKLGPLATHWVHSEDSDQSGRMPRLIWVFAGCTLILFVLSCRGSYIKIRVCV